MLNVDSINKTVTSADLTIGDPVDNLNGPGLLVSDNFESGNFSLWSGGATGDIAPDTSTQHSGRYSAEVKPPAPPATPAPASRPAPTRSPLMPTWNGTPCLDRVWFRC